MIDLLAILLIVFLIVWLICQVVPAPGWVAKFSLVGWMVVATLMLLGVAVAVGG